MLVSPYPDENKDVVWAVAPLRNESGAKHVDGSAIAVAIAAQLTQAQGVVAIPVSRTVTTMRELGLNAFQGPEHARQIAEALGADAILVGSITDYDPYNPPKIGVTLSLYSRARNIRTPFKKDKELDPLDLMGAVSDRSFKLIQADDPDKPLSVASEHFDGANHEVQYALRAYANGRFEDGASPLGWRRFLASMTLFTQFAAHRMVERLLDAERIRLAKQAIAAHLERSR